MRSIAALFCFASLACATLLPATEVTVDESADDDSDGHHRRTFCFTVKVSRDETLVMHGTRWEDDRKVLEIEEKVTASDGRSTFKIGLTEVAPDYWRLNEPGAEQHLQGVRLGRLVRSATALELELLPVTAKRSYRFTWEARIVAGRGATKGKSRQILLPAGRDRP